MPNTDAKLSGELAVTAKVGGEVQVAGLMLLFLVAGLFFLSTHYPG